MDAIETDFSLRSRLGAADSLTVEDPFAGDDEPWAPEDWIGDWAGRPETDEDTRARFFVGLGLSALAWLATAAAALQVYRLLA